MHRALSFFIALALLLGGVFLRGSVSWAKSQGVSLSGRILLKGKRDPVEGAGLFLRELRRGVYTDEKGQYKLKARPGTYTVIIKAIGYYSYKGKLTLTGATKKDFYLEVDPKQQLKTVVRVRRERETPGQVTFNRKQIREMPGALSGDPIRALQSLPGIARANGLSGRLRIRGASPADTGFLMDGHKLPLQFHFGGGPSFVNDRFIEQIDFFPGGAPASFGRFTSGLVSIQSRVPDERAIHGELYIDIIHAGFYIEIPLGKYWHIAAAARRSYVDAFLGLVTPDALAARYWDFQCKVSFKKDGHTLSLFVFGSDDLVDYQGRVKGDDVPFLGDDPLYLGLRFGRAILQYRYQKGIVDFRLSFAAGYNSTETREPDTNADLWEYPVEARASLVLKVHKTLKLGLGFDGGWQRQTYNFTLPAGEFLSFPNPNSREFTITGEGEKDLLYPGGYVTAEWRPHKSLRISAGLRLDAYSFQERIVTGWDPRGSVRWALNKQWALLASTGLFHRPPDIRQWSEEIGNPDLQLQAAYQVAGGVEYKPIPALQIRVQGFYSYMFDRIIGSGRAIEDDQGNLKRENYNNEGTGRSYGLEVLVKLRPWNGLSGWIAYTLSRAERGDINNGINSLFSYDQTHILNLLLAYDFGHGFKVSARFRLVTGRPYTPIVGSIYDADTDRYRPIRGDRDSARYPTFHQLDLRIDKTWTFNTWSFGVYLDLINAYNAQNVLRYRYAYNYETRIIVTDFPIVPAFGLKGAF